MMTVEQLRETKAAMVAAIDNMTEGNLALVGSLLLNLERLRHQFNELGVKNREMEARCRELEKKVAEIQTFVRRAENAAVVPARNPHLVPCLES